MLSSSRTKSENAEESTKAKTDLWAKLPLKSREIEEGAMQSLMSSWANPAPKADFPFSRHPSRNSSTTPSRSAQLPGVSSDFLLNATQKERSYSNQVNWGSLITEFTSATASMIKNMTVVSKPKTLRQPMELKPRSGRAIVVSERIDVAQAFKKMEMSCSRNRIRREANAQRFHERPGLKRKRLRRQRWRQRFTDGFKATVGRVEELWKQGW
ncbi:hypothetical protein K3495_g3835 [Podosphaera aphanis]|nr:hypothetical protein K3495_g3835 [Podosphaera aphanis]